MKIKDITALKKFTEELERSPRLRKRFLDKTGIWNKDGSLSVNYGGEK